MKDTCSFIVEYASRMPAADASKLALAAAGMFILAATEIASWFAPR